MQRQLNNKRSLTGHRLLAASHSHSELLIIPNTPGLSTGSIVAWSFGKGSVIWRIWPAVLLHIVFAAAIVSLSLRTRITLALPPVLLNVLGVVIGFVISYRAMTGYDRYWMGRSCWTDIIRNSRAMGRLIWFHVPPYLTPQRNNNTDEMMRVMKEKRMALNLIEGFAVALKHHLRGELGMYYEDLYHLVEPLHSHRSETPPLPPPPVPRPRRISRNSQTIHEPLHSHQSDTSPPHPRPRRISRNSQTIHEPLDSLRSDTSPPPPRPRRISRNSQTIHEPLHSLRSDTSPPPPRSRRISRTSQIIHETLDFHRSDTPPPPLSNPRRSSQTIQIRHTQSSPVLRVDNPTSPPRSITSLAPVDNPIIPPINAYGTFNTSTASLSIKSILDSNARRKPATPSAASDISQDQCPDRKHHYLLLPSALPKPFTIMSKISADLVPFMSFFSWVFGHGKKEKSDDDALPTSQDNEGGVARKWTKTDNDQDGKRRPRIAGGGENLPLDILSVLSEWVSVLEGRATVPGGELGGISACISNFEQSLSALEMILTTPLPFVYSAHIRHTVWIYLFFLPFQLVNEFGWSTIGGVGIAAFIYLGFLAAGEEIEQPFGYDTNDLDLDLFTGEIIHGDIGDLKKTPCFNAYHSYPSEKANRSISATVEQIENKKHRYHAEIQEWDADGDGVGDGYGIEDELFGIQQS